MNAETTWNHLALSPDGELVLLHIPEEPPPADMKLIRRISGAAERGSGSLLFHLGLVETQALLPPSLAFWRDFGAAFVTRLTRLENLEDAAKNPRIPFPADEAADRIDHAPPFRGAEYLSLARLEALWNLIGQAFKAECASWNGTVRDFIHTQNPLWNLLGRVCFHLAERRDDPIRPFAFLATYTTGISAHGRPRHAPLAEALREFAGAGNQSELRRLLEPVARAAEKSSLLAALEKSKKIFHPLAWNANQALAFLRDIPTFEESGILCRIPDWWRSARPSVKAEVTIGERAPSLLGIEGLLSFSVEVSFDGEPLTQQEWAQIRNAQASLVLLRGKWVEIDSEKLQRVLDYWQGVRSAGGREISFREGLRLMAGADRGLSGNLPGEIADWSRVISGSWLKKTLEGLQKPEILAAVSPGPEFHGTLRPYQEFGLRWLWFMLKLGLGPCLADDMGLGKTVQVLALLTVLKRDAAAPRKPVLLVVPASLLANWEAEFRRFWPDGTLLIAHPSAVSAKTLSTLGAQDLSGIDLVVTTYGTLIRQASIRAISWGVVILDEAQAIKNPATRQAKAVKELVADGRIVLTGTPVENRLADLWSIFDFLDRGLLGSPKEFEKFVKTLGAAGSMDFAPLRRLVRPYILRRLKTDPGVAPDLPKKTEILTYCSLSKEQVVLYRESVDELAKKIATTDPMERRGIILAFLTRFKQICNHPSHWLGDGGYDPAHSGKFQRLREICEEIASRGEKALVFTQFRELVDPLASFLAGIFGNTGLTLHGETKIRERGAIVKRFQEDAGIGFLVLSLKVGGVGLNLTAASHVIHVDRWWNPAVEAQATDRAFRIGQQRPVMVHPFVCRGTLEERIADLIERKKSLAEGLLGGDAEPALTELSNEELLSLVRLDLRHASTGQE
ncbi:MAG TPA: DEAD/DEAH box helicase [Candidatus Ozemobacteraceae bacterium]|nr:DEAD/DEAH box helicase [Candidatus Ozemobacteraceae bacterium]HQG27711.1 DEAD/DEAH box helicase [Candidatus Ozemobacteraceae bacterium]